MPEILMMACPAWKKAGQGYLRKVK